MLLHDDLSRAIASGNSVKNTNLHNISERSFCLYPKIGKTIRLHYFLIKEAANFISQILKMTSWMYQKVARMYLRTDLKVDVIFKHLFQPHLHPKLWVQENSTLIILQLMSLHWTTRNFVTYFLTRFKTYKHELTGMIFGVIYSRTVYSIFRLITSCVISGCCLRTAVFSPFLHFRIPKFQSKRQIWKHFLKNLLFVSKNERNKTVRSQIFLIGVPTSSIRLQTKMNLKMWQKVVQFGFENSFERNMKFWKESTVKTYVLNRKLRTFKILATTFTLIKQ